MPFSIKDSLDTAGVLTQRGSKLFAGNIPDKDATAVARFKAAGGIPLMKTNLPEFSAWTESDNRVTGRTNNPWNLERTPGGSSGGESAALAAGMSPIGIGSDVMISVRGPAAFTGVAALKATHGRVPYTGHYPRVTSHWWHVGPMARTIRDVALGYSILKGPDGIDGYAIQARDAQADGGGLAGQPVRVGWVSDAAFAPVDPEITAAVAAAAAQLADLGCVVEEVTLPFLGDPFGTLATLVYGEIAPSIKALAAGRETELHAVGAGIVGTPDPSFTDFAAAHAKVEALRSAFAGFFRKYDVLLTPVTPMTATPHGAQGACRQWGEGAVDSRHGGDLALQHDRAARAFGSLRFQLREASDRHPACGQVARRGDHPAPRRNVGTPRRPWRSPSRHLNPTIGFAGLGCPGYRKGRRVAASA